MAREIFKNLPDTTTPLSASKLNGLFNGEEPMGSIVVEDIECKNLYNPSLTYRLSNGNTYFECNIDNTRTYIFQTPYAWTCIYGIDASGNETRFVYEEGKTGDSKIVTFVPTSNEVKIRCSFYSENPISDFTGIQLEKDRLTPYTPYKKFGYNSQESMGEIVVDNISCKNKFNFDAITVPNGTVDYVNKTITVRTFANGTEQTLKQLCPDLEVGKTYALSFKTTGNSNFIHLFGTSTNWMNGTTHIVTQEDLDNTIVVYGNYEVDADVVISEIQIELDKVTPHSPHKQFGYIAGNTNGIEWIKYDDGRCELSGRVTIPATTDVNITFPFELINNEYSILLNYFYQYYALVFLTYHSMEKGGFTINAFQPTTEKLQYDQVVSFHVIGRWKDEITSTSSASTMSLRPDTTEDETTSLEEEVI